MASLERPLVTVAVPVETMVVPEVVAIPIVSVGAGAGGCRGSQGRVFATG
jgi:hypothetical protein